MLGQKILRVITCGLYKGMKNKNNDNYFTKLVKEDNNNSAINFFLLCTLFVGIILLIVPIIGMTVDIFFNHTMTINLSDMALYIGAVAGIFASGGLTSAWTEFSYSKYDIPPIDEEGIPLSEKGPNIQRRRYVRNKYKNNEDELKNNEEELII